MRSTALVWLLEGVEHVEGSGESRKLCTYPIRCLTVRISAANAVGGVNNY